VRGRRYERIRCPGCQQVIAAYVPQGSDGTDLRVVPHHGPSGPCAASDRGVVLAHGRWTVAG